MIAGIYLTRRTNEKINTRQERMLSLARNFLYNSSPSTTSRESIIISAVLYQMCQQANWELVIMLLPDKPVKWWINECEYNLYIFLFEFEFETIYGWSKFWNLKPLRQTSALFHERALGNLYILVLFPLLRTTDIRKNYLIKELLN